MSGVLEGLFAAWLFVLGVSVGSFVNVVIARGPGGRSSVRPRSRCPRCGHMLAWYENVPLVSWLALRARCRSCRAPISWRYPAVELLTGLLFLACLNRFGWTFELALGLMFVTLLVPLAFIDLEHWILPFSLTLPGTLAGLALSAPLGPERLVDALVGAAVGFLALRLMEFVGWVVFKKEALGGGDKFLVALLGAFLTWRSLLGIIFLSSLQGALVGGLLLLTTGRAGPAPQQEAPAQPTEEPAPTLSWAFLAPGLPLWRRLALLPYSLLLQPIPDEPTDVQTGEEVEWVPGATNIPFGPWLALAGLEIMLLGPWLAEVLPEPLQLLVAGPL